jgi:hypothetical protein
MTKNQKAVQSKDQERSIPNGFATSGARRVKALNGPFTNPLFGVTAGLYRSGLMLSISISRKLKTANDLAESRFQVQSNRREELVNNLGTPNLIRRAFFGLEVILETALAASLVFNICSTIKHWGGNPCAIAESRKCFLQF